LVEKKKPFMAYADINLIIDFDCRGVLAQNQTEAEQLVKKEVLETLGPLAKVFGSRGIWSDDIKIWWKISPEKTDKNWPFQGDALARVTLLTGNRHPWTMEDY
jgi:hypothetical protein